jgi:ribosome maturation factor RimP
VSNPQEGAAVSGNKKKHPGGIIGAVRETAQPLANSLGLILWDVRFFKEGADWIVLLVIDKEKDASPVDEDAPPGVTLNDCEALSRAIDPLLDEADFIDRSYRLQVSSPGLERKLRTQNHLNAYLGEKVFIRLQRAFEGKREYHGILANLDGASFTLELPDGRGLTCTLPEVAWIKADDFQSWDHLQR